MPDAYPLAGVVLGRRATGQARSVPGDIVDVVYRLEPDCSDGERRLHMVVLDLCR